MGDDAGEQLTRTVIKSVAWVSWMDLLVGCLLLGWLIACSTRVPVRAMPKRQGDREGRGLMGGCACARGYVSVCVCVCLCVSCC